MPECIDFSMYLLPEIIFVWKTRTSLPSCILYLDPPAERCKANIRVSTFVALGQSFESPFLTFHSFCLCNEELLEACRDFFSPQLSRSLICHQQVPGHALVNTFSHL